MTPLRIALAGAGMISWHHLVAWQNLGGRVRVVAICDPDEAKAAARAREFSIPAVYRDAAAMFAGDAFDALDVASPRETHGGWVEAAADRGIGVLCQKPLAPSLAEAEALVSKVEHQCRLMVHENWRFRPWFRALKQMMVRGDLGDVLLARMSVICSGMLPDANGRRATFERQPFMQHESRLMITEVMIHHLDTMRFLCGEMRVVGARTAHTLADVRGETSAAILLETASGAAIEVIGNYAAPGYPARACDRLEMVGGKASALFDDWTLQRLGAQPQNFDRDAGYQASFDAVIAHFVECLATGAPFETSPADNLCTLRLVEDAYASAGGRAGQP